MSTWSFDVNGITADKQITTGYDGFVAAHATGDLWIKRANASHNSREDSRVTIALGIEPDRGD